MEKKKEHTSLFTAFKIILIIWMVFFFSWGAYFTMAVIVPITSLFEEQVTKRRIFIAFFSSIALILFGIIFKQLIV